MDSLLRTDNEAAETYEKYVNPIYRICFSFMKNPSDAEDMVQETFIKLINKKPEFDSEEHKKAWLIVTSSNLCRDALKRKSRMNESIDDYTPVYNDSPDENSTLKAILQLSPKYKTAVYLYYYDGYSTTEIAKMLKLPVSTVKNRLARARAQLKLMLGDGTEL